MKVFAGLQIWFQTMLVLLLSTPVQALQGDDIFDAENLLVRYTEKSSQIRSSGHNITIKIYKDGQALVAMPEAMKISGYYRVQLTQEKLDVLWALLIDESILMFDAQQIQKRLSEERRLSRSSHTVLTSVSDKAEVTLECYPNRYWPPGQAGNDEDAVKYITWSGLRWDAERYSYIKPIRLLSEIQQFMLSIIDRNDMQPVDHHFE